MKNRFIVKDIGEEGAMVYDQKRDEVHFLNPTAYLIWTLFRENKLSNEIERTLLERYHSKDQRDISLDVETCLRELREKELLSLSPQKKQGIKKRKQEKKG
jgi:hypothetical protein